MSPTALPDNGLKQRAPAVVDKPLRIAVGMLTASTLGLTALIAFLKL